MNLDLVNLTPEKYVELASKLPNFGYKVRKFIDAYILTQSPYKSAIEAGYSKSRAYSVAYKLLSNPDVKLAIELGKYELRIRNDVNKDYFVAHLKKIIEDKFVKVSDKISALSLLAKITGYIKEQPQDNKQLVVLKIGKEEEKAINLTQEN